jgi:hypothetical protein
MEQFNLTSSAKTLIQTIVKPYSDMLDTEGITIEDLRLWVQNSFKDANILAKIDLETEDMSVLKANIIDALMASIESALTLYQEDKEVLPWDIITALSKDQTSIFKIETEELPITVSINGQKYDHMMSAELVYGLLLYAKTDTNKYELSLYDTVIEPELPERFQNQTNKFVLTLTNDEKIYFNSPDLMTGFTTGAMWLEQDHHKFWKHLHETDKNIELTF